jgi:hypothetical protein
MDEQPEKVGKDLGRSFSNHVMLVTCKRKSELI